MQVRLGREGDRVRGEASPGGEKTKLDCGMAAVDDMVRRAME